MSGKEWFVGRNAKQVGPYRFETLQSAASTGKLKPDDLVWCEGMLEWRRADSLPDLSALFPTKHTLPTTAPANETLTATAESLPAASNANYFVRHWRGELSLPISYWVNYALLGAILAVVVTLLAASDITQSLSMRGTGVLTLALMLSTAVVSFWSIIGVWRSADHHVARGGSGGWAQAAKVLVCLGIIRLVLTWTEQTPIAAQSFTLATGRDTMPASTLRVINRATEIEIAGGLSFGTADSLKTVLDATPTVKLVQLNNTGGWISEGERLAQIVKDRKLATYTARECDSACLLVFLAGTERFLGAHARLGFHEASVAGLTGEVAEKGNRTFRAALQSRGAPPEFIEHALATPASSIWYPTQQELRDAHIVTAVVDESQFGQTGIAGWQDPDKIERAERVNEFETKWSEYLTNFG